MFLVRHGDDFAAPVEHDEARAGRALVDRTHISRHDSIPQGSGLEALGLGVVPKSVHLLQRRMRRGGVSLGQLSLDMVEAPLEFGVGAAQHALRVHLGVACDVGDCEKKIGEQNSQIVPIRDTYVQCILEELKAKLVK